MSTFQIFTMRAASLKNFDPPLKLNKRSAHSATSPSFNLVVPSVLQLVEPEMEQAWDANTCRGIGMLPHLVCPGVSNPKYSSSYLEAVKCNISAAVLKHWPFYCTMTTAECSNNSFVSVLLVDILFVPLLPCLSGFTATTFLELHINQHNHFSLLFRVDMLCLCISLDII